MKILGDLIPLKLSTRIIPDIKTEQLLPHFVDPWMVELATHIGSRKKIKLSLGLGTFVVLPLITVVGDAMQVPL